MFYQTCLCKLPAGCPWTAVRDGCPGEQEGCDSMCWGEKPHPPLFISYTAFFISYMALGSLPCNHSPRPAPGQPAKPRFPQGGEDGVSWGAWGSVALPAHLAMSVNGF